MKNKLSTLIAGSFLALTLTITAADKPAELKWERVGDRLQRTVIGTVSKWADDRDDGGLGYKLSVNETHILGCGRNEKTDSTSVSLVKSDAKGEVLFVYEQKRSYHCIKLGSCFHYDLDGDGTIDAWVKDANTPYVRINGRDVEVRQSKTNFRNAVDAEYSERLNDEDGTTIIFQKGTWVKKR